MNRGSWTWLAPTLLGALTVLIYLTGIGGGFMFDDPENLMYVRRHLQGDLTLWSAMVSNDSGQLGRPVAMLSFLFDGWISELDPRWMKLVNILTHLICGVVLHALLRRVLAVARLETKLIVPTAYFLTAAWLVLPIQVSTVLYIVQRMTQLSALFVLLALLAYVRGRMRLADQPRSAHLDLFLWFPLCTLLATLSKENGALAPLYALVLELSLFAPTNGNRPRSVRAFFWLFLILPGTVALTAMALHPGLALNGYAARDFSLSERVLTEGRVLWDYVRQILVPYGPRMGLSHDHFAISRSASDPATTLPALLAWVLVAVLAWRWRRSMPLLCLGAFWFLAGHAMESTVLPLEIYFEHRNYLPLVGVLLACCGIVVRVAQEMPPLSQNFRRLLPALPVILVAVYASATAARASIWGSPQALAEQAIRENPNSFRVRIELAGRFAFAGQFADADPQLNIADTLASPRQAPTVALVRILAHCGQPPSDLDALVTQFEQRAQGYMDMSTGQAIRAVSEKYEAGECSSLDGARLARTFFRWIRAAPQEGATQTLWKAHYYATRLLAATGALREAAIQARIVYDSSDYNAGVGVLLYQLLSSLEDYEGCRAVVAELKRRAGKEDLATLRAIATFEAHLASLETSNAQHDG